jgi:multidrug efflux pump subunit AcrA (membrane-fusion protein)
MHKQWLWLLFLMIVLVEGCASPAPTPIATALPAGERSAGGVVTASGQVVPAREVMLSFTLTGKVQSLSVVEGDEVEAGQVLAVLQTDALEAGVAQAEAGVKAAQARLALLEAGPRPEQVALAEAQLKVAEAALSQAVVERGRPDLGATEAEIAAAEASVAQAQADRRAAVEYHDKTMTCVEWSGKTICPALGPYEEQARYALQLADEALAAAQAHLDALHAGAEAEFRAVEADISASEAQRDSAQAQLDLALNRASAEDIAAAQAGVAQAQGALDAAQAALDQATLRAPFAGTVASVDVNASETVLPGHAVLKLADLSHMQVTTIDLGEQDVAQVTVEQRATVYVESLGLEIGGRVARVASRAEVLGGDMVYRVTIELDEQPAGLRWGMSADVEITIE